MVVHFQECHKYWKRLIHFDYSCIMSNVYFAEELSLLLIGEAYLFILVMREEENS